MANTKSKKTTSKKTSSKPKAVAGKSVKTERAETATNRANTISQDLENKVASGYFNGKDGVITTVEMNQMAFQIVNGNLMLTYEEGNTDAEKFSIDDNGNLIYTIT